MGGRVVQFDSAREKACCVLRHTVSYMG